MLSATAEHALRAMAHLASAGPDEAILGRDLADSSGVPPNYLSKILLDLKRAGMVDAARGQGGGYRLRRPAIDIRLIEIVEVFDQTRAHPRCLLAYSDECSDLTACSAHERWKKVRTAYLAFLETTSLADIAAGHGRTARSGAHRKSPR